MSTKKSVSKKTEIKPLHDRVLIKEIEDITVKTESGIYLPETVDQDKGSKKGKVVAVGNGRYEHGSLIPMSVKVGDTIMFIWGDKVKIDNEDYYLVREGEISAIIK